MLQSHLQVDNSKWITWSKLGRFQQDVVREAAENDDILQHNIVEHPWNLTLVNINGLSWYMKKQSERIPYVLQTRSETFVDVRKWSYIFR